MHLLRRLINPASSCLLKTLKFWRIPLLSHQQLNIQDVVEGAIEKIAFGGEGILRFKGFVIFVPFTAIGDQILCEIIEIKKNFAKGKVIHLIKEGPHRAHPLCPYFGSCGGCQIQHLDQHGQNEYKLSAVKDAFRHIGHLKLPEITLVPAKNNWGYRRHITLQLKPENKGFQAGYVAIDNQTILQVQTCPIFNPPDSPWLASVQEFLLSLSNPNRLEGKLILLKHENEQLILSFEFPSLEGLNTHEFQAGLQHHPFIGGIAIRSPKQTFIFGEIKNKIKWDSLTFYYNPFTFVQNHPEQSANIYSQILNLLPPSKKILDLYCGFGMSSLLLAKQGHQVTGIEGNPASIELAKENGKINGIKQAKFFTGDVERTLPKAGKEWDALLVNPPRTGLPKTLLKKLLSLQVKEWLYVSCMPATLARDLAVLCEQHYEITFCKAYDMFPQTAHVETLVFLNRSS